MPQDLMPQDLIPQKAKLTVRVDSTSLAAAKTYAAMHRTSLSRLISEFLGNLPVEDSPQAQTPILRKLTGILPAGVSADDYREYLAEKYGS